MLPLSGNQIDDTKRKIVFPNIKNKFRFVTVSLLLASLVTVISSASAEDVGFSFTVNDCSASDIDPTWSPTIDALTDLTVDVGEIGDVVVRYGFMDGSTVCVTAGYDDHLVDGNVSTSLSITNEGWTTSTDCGDVACLVTSTDLDVSGTYTVPSGATSGIYSGVFRLTWTPDPS